MAHLCLPALQLVVRNERFPRTVNSQLCKELFDPPSNIVADLADFLDWLTGGVIQRPVFVPLPSLPERPSD
jgi:hypothetical protein